ncbi:MAG: Ltp family lipoprotein, partial [Curtobacterium sp.]
MTTPEPQGGGTSPTPPPYQQEASTQTFAPHPGAPTPQQRTAGLAIAALVVGIVAFVFGWVPVFGAILGVVAIVLGAIALRKRQSKGLAVTGLVLGAVAAITSITFAAGLGAAFNSASDSAKQSSVVAETATPAPVAAEESESASPSESAEPSEAASESTEAAPATPVEYTSALVKAESYSEMMHMSKAGIYDQLTSEYGEQFSAEAAQWAIDHVQADWNANALEKAKSYQADMSM